MVNKMTASQNVTQGRKSSTSVHLSPDVGHGIGQGLPNDRYCAWSQNAKWEEAQTKKWVGGVVKLISHL